MQMSSYHRACDRDDGSNRLEAASISRRPVRRGLLPVAVAPAVQCSVESERCESVPHTRNSSPATTRRRPADFERVTPRRDGPIGVQRCKSRVGSNDAHETAFCWLTVPAESTVRALRRDLTRVSEACKRTARRGHARKPVCACGEREHKVAPRRTCTPYADAAICCDSCEGL